MEERTAFLKEERERAVEEWRPRFRLWVWDGEGEREGDEGILVLGV